MDLHQSLSVLVLTFGCIFISVHSQAVPAQNPSAFAALDVLRGRGPYNAAEIQELLKTARPGTTYPNLLQIPRNLAFNCAQTQQPGYYANIDTGCQVFHRCEPNNPTYTYLCPVSTVFNQITLTCDYFYNVRCQNSAQFTSYSNPRLYLGANVKFLDDGGNTGSAAFGSSSASGSTQFGVSRLGADASGAAPAQFGNSGQFGPSGSVNQSTTIGSSSDYSYTYARGGAPQANVQSSQATTSNVPTAASPLQRASVRAAIFRTRTTSSPTITAAPSVTEIGAGSSFTPESQSDLPYGTIQDSVLAYDVPSSAFPFLPLTEDPSLDSSIIPRLLSSSSASSGAPSAAPIYLVRLPATRTTGTPAPVDTENPSVVMLVTTLNTSAVTSDTESLPVTYIDDVATIDVVSTSPSEESSFRTIPDYFENAPAVLSIVSTTEAPISISETSRFPFSLNVATITRNPSFSTYANSTGIPSDFSTRRTIKNNNFLTFFRNPTAMPLEIGAAAQASTTDGSTAPWYLENPNPFSSNLATPTATPTGNQYSMIVPAFVGTSPNAPLIAFGATASTNQFPPFFENLTAMLRLVTTTTAAGSGLIMKFINPFDRRFTTKTPVKATTNDQFLTIFNIPTAMSSDVATATQTIEGTVAGNDFLTLLDNQTVTPFAPTELARPQAGNQFLTIFDNPTAMPTNIATEMPITSESGYYDLSVSVIPTVTPSTGTTAAESYEFFTFFGESTVWSDTTTSTPTATAMTVNDLAFFENPSFNMTTTANVTTRNQFLTIFDNPTPLPSDPAVETITATAGAASPGDSSLTFFENPLITPFTQTTAVTRNQFSNMFETPSTMPNNVTTATINSDQSFYESQTGMPFTASTQRNASTRNQFLTIFDNPTSMPPVPEKSDLTVFDSYSSAVTVTKASNQIVTIFENPTAFPPAFTKATATGGNALSFTRNLPTSRTIPANNPFTKSSGTATAGATTLANPGNFSLPPVSLTSFSQRPNTFPVFVTRATNPPSAAAKLGNTANTSVSTTRTSKPASTLLAPTYDDKLSFMMVCDSGKVAYYGCVGYNSTRDYWSCVLNNTVYTADKYCSTNGNPFKIPNFEARTEEPGYKIVPFYI